MFRHRSIRLSCSWVLLLAAFANAARAEVIEADVVIFGGTSGGIAAAVQAKRMGKSVAVAEWRVRHSLIWSDTV